MSYDTLVISFTSTAKTTITRYDRSVTPPVRGDKLPRKRSPMGWLLIDEDDPDVIEALSRVADGTVDVLVGDDLETAIPIREAIRQTPGGDWSHWAATPFAPGDMEHFFWQLMLAGQYLHPTDNHPARFQFPGVVEGANRRYYKRDEDASTPAVSALSELTDAGWTADIPYGGAVLNAIDVLDTPEGVAVGDTYRVYHRRKDETAAIVALARAWYFYWRGLSSAEQGINTRMTARKHWEHAIGRLWEEKPHDGRISVFYGTDRTATPHDARDAEDWMLGNAEQWVNEWGGFAAFVTAINTSTKRTLLEAQLTDYTFCHVNEDGTVGDRLSNGGSGLPQATWDAYQATHYMAAVRHGLETLDTPTLEFSAAKGETVTAQVEPTGGLEPYTYAMVGTSPWFSISESGLVTTTPTSGLNEQVYAAFVDVTDALGNTDRGVINIRVTAAPTE